MPHIPNPQSYIYNLFSRCANSGAQLAHKHGRSDHSFCFPFKMEEIRSAQLMECYSVKYRVGYTTCNITPSSHRVSRVADKAMPITTITATKTTTSRPNTQWLQTEILPKDSGWSSGFLRSPSHFLPRHYRCRAKFATAHCHYLNEMSEHIANILPHPAAVFE